MSKFYKYGWKKGLFVEPVRFDQELMTDDVFVDLRNGDAHRVVSINEVKPEMKDDPKAVIQSMPVKTLAQEELTALRDKCQFPQTNPEWYFAILPRPTTC